MIYTVTFNPSLDYIAIVDHFTPGKVNRTQSELLFPGGKGINVSIVLNNLGMDSVALGFIAGFTGKEIKIVWINLAVCPHLLRLIKDYPELMLNCVRIRRQKLMEWGRRSIRKH